MIKNVLLFCIYIVIIEEKPINILSFQCDLLKIAIFSPLNNSFFK